MSDQAKATAWGFFEAQDRDRGGPAETVCAPGYTAHLGGFPVMDREAHAAFSAAFYAAFPDMLHTLEQSLAQDDEVALRFVITGTNTESFMGSPPTGRSIALEVISLVTVEGPKVKELRSQFDQVSLMQQLGAMPGG